MENQQRNPTEPEHLGIEMTTFRPPELPTRQVGPFPGTAKRLSTNSQTPNREQDGHQLVGSIPPIEDEGNYAMHATVITSGINRSNGASDGGKSIEQQLPQLIHRDILDVQDTEATGGEGYFLERRELKILTERGESTRMFDRYDFDTEIVRGSSTCNDEAEDDEIIEDESYFLAESELQFHRASQQGGRLSPDKSERTQKLVYSSIRKSKRGTKKQHKTCEESIDDEYWRRTYLRNDDRTSEQSSLEQGVSEPKLLDSSLQPRRHLTKPELIQRFDPSIHNPNSVAKQHRAATIGESSEVDGEYWRSYLNNDDTTLDQPSLEQGVFEPKRQWYRSKKMRPEDFRPPPRRGLSIFCLVITILMIIIIAAFFIPYILVLYALRIPF